MLKRILPITVVVGLLVGGVMVGAARQQARTLGRQPDTGWLVPTNQLVDPIGTVHLTRSQRPKDLAVSPDGKRVAVLATGRLYVYNADGTEAGEVGLSAGPLGVAWSADSTALYVSLNAGTVARFEEDNGRWAEKAKLPSPEMPQTVGARRPKNPQPSGLAVTPDGRRLFAAMGILNVMVVYNLADNSIEKVLKTGICPYHVGISPDGKWVVAANRGGPMEAGGLETEPSAGTQVPVEKETDAAARGSLTLISTADLTTREVEVGRQPAGMAFSADSRLVWVACSGEDAVTSVDLPEGKREVSVSVRPLEDPFPGQMPSDVAVLGTELFVSCGGTNAVAVFSAEEKPELKGWLPAGWYPIAVGTIGENLVVASAKGVGARPENPLRGYGVHSSVGMVQFVSQKDRGDLAFLTRKVASLNNWGKEMPARPGRAPVPVPERVGEPSVFKHVVYIIKENVTYDQVLGDMPEGNGDKELCTFPEQVTPNHHALAREFVLLDNTYTSGTNSADGHHWVASSVANDYLEHNYGAHERSYPYDGGDPLSYSTAGFLWTSALKAGKTVRVYGEFANRPRIINPETGRTPSWRELWDDYKSGANRMQITSGTDQAALKPLLHPRYIGFPSIVSDQWRADQYLAELKEFEKNGTMPDLSIMLLPNDHTSGTRANMPTPRASVADNDLALGRIIEGITKSRFWKDTLILVVQDDSQMGLDHVDGHRMPAFVISPYTRRKAVVHEPYNHTGFARTIGLVLGVPPMNRFDRSGQPLTLCFTDKPNFGTYTHRPARIPLDELNPDSKALSGEARRLAEACEKMDWSDVDRVDPETVSRAVWRSIRGNQPFPTRHFHPPADTEEKMEREGREHAAAAARRTETKSR
jgi:DNA-binding beta-propeller fold protein YncE